MTATLKTLDKAQRTDRIFHEVSCAIGETQLFPDVDQLLVRVAKLVRQRTELKMEIKRLREKLASHEN